MKSFKEFNSLCCFGEPKCETPVNSTGAQKGFRDVFCLICGKNDDFSGLGNNPIKDI